MIGITSGTIYAWVKKRANLAGALSALDRMESSAGELAQYVYPKKKAIEHSGEIGVKTFADFILASEIAEDKDETKSGENKCKANSNAKR